jgi:hypothetical protein
VTTNDQPRLVVVTTEQVHPDEVAPPARDQAAGEARDAERQDGPEAVERPAKVMRIGAMVRQLLEEVRQAPLDEASRTRLREIYDTSLRELQEGLSPELAEELARMAPPFDPESVPTEAELRVAQAQLVGWLEGLFSGIQATMFAQQMAQRAQLEEARRRGLPPGRQREEGEERPMPGTYL